MNDWPSISEDEETVRAAIQAAQLVPNRDSDAYDALARLVTRADAIAVICELLDAWEELEVERRNIWSLNRTERLNAALTRSSKADAAARRFLASDYSQSTGDVIASGVKGLRLMTRDEMNAVLDHEPAQSGEPLVLDAIQIGFCKANGLPTPTAAGVITSGLV